MPARDTSTYEVLLSSNSAAAKLVTLVPGAGASDWAAAVLLMPVDGLGLLPAWVKASSCLMIVKRVVVYRRCRSW